jgi:uncharacterized protein (DUF736 family)
MMEAFQAMSLGRRPFDGRWRTLHAQPGVDLVPTDSGSAGKGRTARYARVRSEIR